MMRDQIRERPIGGTIVAAVAPLRPTNAVLRFDHCLKRDVETADGEPAPRRWGDGSELSGNRDRGRADLRQSFHGGNPCCQGDLFYIGGASINLIFLLDDGFLRGACLAIIGRTLEPELVEFGAPDSEIAKSTATRLATNGGVSWEGD